jgi:sugar lactone lactonase YvrE
MLASGFLYANFGAPYSSDLHPIALHSRRCICFWIILIAFFPALTGCSHAHSQAASPVKAPPIEFVQEWGMRGSEPGQLENPIGLALDPIGRVYFADRTTSFIQKFEATGIPLLCFETWAARTADAIAVDSGGAIYVLNSRTGAMQLFFPQGDPLRALRIAPRRHYEGPLFFSIDADGRIYVPDPTGARVQVFNSHGQLLKIWRISPEASENDARPFAAIANSDAVYVGDAVGGRILKFTRDGVRSAEFKSPDSADVSPLWGLAAAGKHVFALRGSPPRLEVWSEDGRRELVDTLGNRLSGVESAAYLGADAAGDLILLDPEARRVLHFRTHLDLP